MIRHNQRIGWADGNCRVSLQHCGSCFISTTSASVPSRGRVAANSGDVLGDELADDEDEEEDEAGAGGALSEPEPEVLVDDVSSYPKLLYKRRRKGFDAGVPDIAFEAIERCKRAGLSQTRRVLSSNQTVDRVCAVCVQVVLFSGKSSLRQSTRCSRSERATEASLKTPESPARMQLISGYANVRQ